MAGHAAEAALSPVALALEYLAHPFSKPSLIPPVARPLSPPTLASLIPGFTMPSFKTIGRLSNLVTFATMTVMLIRTYVSNLLPLILLARSPRLLNHMTNAAHATRFPAFPVAQISVRHATESR